MKYIDVHAHVFPDNVVEKVICALETFYGYKWLGRGTPADLLDSMAEAGITRSVIFSAATKPEQVCHINDYIASLQRANPDRFIGFGTLHPDFPEPEAELERIRSLGLQGLKFHPDFQKLCIDQPEMMRIYRAAGEDFPILFHVGDRRFTYSSPKRMAHVLDEFPRLTVIAAHMGGYSEPENAWKYLIGRNVLLDVSSTIGKVGTDEIKRMIEAHGVDRILFASDYPAVRQKRAIEDVLSLGLTPEENEKIFFRNAERLFGRTF